MTASYVCSECGEPVRNVPPTALTPPSMPPQEWSHLDGEPLCPVMGECGYEPGRPVPATPEPCLTCGEPTLDGLLCRKCENAFDEQEGSS